MKLVAFFKSAGKDNCKFFDDNNQLLYYSTLEKSGNNCKVSVFNSSNALISSIVYAESTNLKKNTFVVEISNQEFIFSFNRDGFLVCEDQGLKIEGVFLDKWFNLLKNGKCFCSVRSFTFIKDWLSAKYTIDIFDVDESDLCITLCVMKFISKYESAVLSTTNYFGKI